MKKLQACIITGWITLLRSCWAEVINLSITFKKKFIYNTWYIVQIQLSSHLYGFETVGILNYFGFRNRKEAIVLNAPGTPEDRS